MLSLTVEHLRWGPPSVFLDNFFAPNNTTNRHCLAVPKNERRPLDGKSFPNMETYVPFWKKTPVMHYSVLCLLFYNLGKCQSIFKTLSLLVRPYQIKPNAVGNTLTVLQGFLAVENLSIDGYMTYRH